jgi:hypothetical protein
MRRLRQIHHYLGVFFAPAIIFFAFSGALQSFGLHENKGGGPYKPPAWIVIMASVHKHDALPHPKPAATSADQGSDAGDKGGRTKEHKHEGTPAAKTKSALPLRIFAGLLSAGLIGTALIGVYIALKNKATRNVSILMLVIGALLPVALLFI